MLKEQLRQEIRNQKRQYSWQELRVLSLPIISRLMSHPKLKAAKTILLYYSLPDEVDTHDLLVSLLNQNKTLLLPKVTGDGLMELRQFTSMSDLKEGAFHIMEPQGKPYDDLSKIDLAIIPGISFDNQGHRLGRGKGYYDRFLKAIPTIYKIGICFDFQKRDIVPTDENDVVMDEVI